MTYWVTLFTINKVKLYSLTYILCVIINACNKCIILESSGVSFMLPVLHHSVPTLSSLLGRNTIWKRSHTGLNTPLRKRYVQNMMIALCIRRIGTVVCMQSHSAIYSLVIPFSHFSVDTYLRTQKTYLVLLDS